MAAHRDADRSAERAPRSGAVDLSLYAKIDEALVGLDAAFQSLVSAGLARDEEDEQSQPSETVGAPVFAREIGAHASQALQAIHRLKQTSIHSDWKALSENKEHVRLSLELEMAKFTQRLNKLKYETQSLIQATEAHFTEFPESHSLQAAEAEDDVMESP